jgi:hypothetical protein
LNFAGKLLAKFGVQNGVVAPETARKFTRNFWFAADFARAMSSRKKFSDFPVRSGSFRRSTVVFSVAVAHVLV